VTTVERLTEAQPDRSDAGSKAVQPRTAALILPMALMFVFSVYFLAPVAWLFVASTKSSGDLTSTSGYWFSDFRLGTNLSDLFAEDGGIYLRWLLNSILYACGGALIGTLLAAMAGYGLAKYHFRGRELVFSVVLGGVLVPATALALPLFLLVAQVDLANTFWAVFLPSVVSPFGVFLSRIYAAASVPEELIEAGRLDGAGEFRIFFTVGIRLMAPALVTIFLFQFVAIWNNFLLPLVMLTNEHLYPITLGLFVWNSQLSRDPDLKSLVLTGSLLSVLPLIIAFLSLQRFWRSGLAAGGVK
jgi:multiple sugar transport system permease protein